MKATHINHFVLLSGGIDSTTCLGIAKSKQRHSAVLGRDYYTAVSVDYGQRHKREIESAEKVARYYTAEHRVLKLDGMPKTMLTDERVAVPDISYDQIEGVSPTYVPFRNGQMLSLIAAQAQDWVIRKSKELVAIGEMVDVSAIIYAGVHAEDAANWAYPDCTPEFIGAMANAIYVGTYGAVRLQAPLQYMNKQQIIMEGTSLCVPYHLTWSCYKGGDKHCGTCPTCRSRHAGFVNARIADPTEYASIPGSI